MATKPLEQPGAIATGWRRFRPLGRRSIPVAARVRRSGHVAKRFPFGRAGSSLVSMNLAGCSLLASMLADDRESVDRQLTDPATDDPHAAWLASARRGEHWLLSYETIRAAALGYIGEQDRGRRELAQAHALLDGRWMQGVEEAPLRLVGPEALLRCAGLSHVEPRSRSVGEFRSSGRVR